MCLKINNRLRFMIRIAAVESIRYLSVVGEDLIKIAKTFQRK